MISRLRNIIRSGGFKNILTLISGTAFAQLLQILVSPVLSRLYTPSQFGVFALYTSLTKVLGIVVTGKYEMAIMLPKERRDGISLLGLSALIAIAFSVVSFVLLVICYHPFALLLNLDPSTAQWLYIVPLTVLIFGLLQAFNYWSNREGKYRRIAVSRVSRSITRTSVTILLGFGSIKQIGLIIGNVVGQLTAAFYLIYHSFKGDRLSETSLDKEEIRRNANAYSNFPRFTIFGALFESISSQAPIFLFSSLYNTVVLGYFGFSHRIINAPSALIASAFADVFRQRASKKYAETGECRKEFVETFKYLSLLGVIPFSILFFIAPPLFSFFFGSKWIESGELVRIMTPMYLLQFIVSPLSNVIIISQNQRTDLIIQISLFFCSVAAIYVGYSIFASFRMSVALFTATYCLKYVIEFFFAYKYSSGK